MTDKPHIVRVVADEVRQQLYHLHRGLNEVPRPRLLGEEIGVEFENGEFIPYADLGYSGDTGFFRISETRDLANDSAPYAAGGRLIDLGQIIVTPGAARRLQADEIRGLLDRHAGGDFGDYGEFYDLDVDDTMMRTDPAKLPGFGSANKVSILSGIGSIVSSYIVREHRIWVITEAGENRSTILLFAGPARN